MHKPEIEMKPQLQAAGPQLEWQAWVVAEGIAQLSSAPAIF